MPGAVQSLCRHCCAILVSGRVSGGTGCAQELTPRKWHPWRSLTTPRLGDIVTGAFTPVLAKHSKSFSLTESISVGVDRFSGGTSSPCESRSTLGSGVNSRISPRRWLICEAFVEGKTGSPETSCTRKVPYAPLGELRGRSLNDRSVSPFCIRSTRCVAIAPAIYPPL